MNLFQADSSSAARVPRSVGFGPLAPGRPESQSEHTLRRAPGRAYGGVARPCGACTRVPADAMVFSGASRLTRFVHPTNVS